MEIHKFVNNLEVKLQEKEGVLSELKAQKEELQSDFKYNLSLLRERDQELIEFEKVLQEKDAEIHARDAEIKRLKGKLSDELDVNKNLKNYIKEQEEIHSLNFRKTTSEFQEQFYTKDKQELVFTSRIQELSLLLSQKEEELLGEIQKNNSAKEKISQQNLLGMVNVNLCFQDKIQELQELVKKQDILLMEKDCLLNDLTLQNDFKYRKISSLEEKIVDLDTCNQLLEEEKRQLEEEKEVLQIKVVEIEKEMNAFNMTSNMMEQENERKVSELDDIICGLSLRNEFIKKECTDLLSQKEDELKELKVEIEVLMVKLEQEKSIKESEKNMFLKNEERMAVDLQSKNKEILDFRIKISALESDFKQTREQLDNVNGYLKKLESDNQELRQRLKLGKSFFSDKLDAIGWKEKTTEMKEKINLIELTLRQKELELNKTRKDVEIEKSLLLKEIQELKEKLINDDKSAQVLELEGTNQQLSAIIHQMRIDMESLQEEFKGSQGKDNNSLSQEKDDVLKQNSFLKLEILDLQTRLKKLTFEKNRMVIVGLILG